MADGKYASDQIMYQTTKRNISVDFDEEDGIPTIKRSKTSTTLDEETDVSLPSSSQSRQLSQESGYQSFSSFDKSYLQSVFPTSFHPIRYASDSNTDSSSLFSPDLMDSNLPSTVVLAASSPAPSTHLAHDTNVHFLSRLPEHITETCHGNPRNELPPSKLRRINTSENTSVNSKRRQQFSRRVKETSLIKCIASDESDTDLSMMSVSLTERDSENSSTAELPSWLPPAPELPSEMEGCSPNDSMENKANIGSQPLSEQLRNKNVTAIFGKMQRGQNVSTFMQPERSRDDARSNVSTVSDSNKAYSNPTSKVLIAGHFDDFITDCDSDSSSLPSIDLSPSPDNQCLSVAPVPVAQSEISNSQLLAEKEGDIAHDVHLLLKQCVKCTTPLTKLKEVNLLGCHSSSEITCGFSNTDEDHRLEFASETSSITDSIFNERSNYFSDVGYDGDLESDSDSCVCPNVDRKVRPRLFKSQRRLVTRAPSSHSITEQSHRGCPSLSQRNISEQEHINLLMKECKPCSVKLTALQNIPLHKTISLKTFSKYTSQSPASTIADSINPSSNRDSIALETIDQSGKEMQHTCPMLQKCTKCTVPMTDFLKASNRFNEISSKLTLKELQQLVFTSSFVCPPGQSRPTSDRIIQTDSLDNTAKTLNTTSNCEVISTEVLSHTKSNQTPQNNQTYSYDKTRKTVLSVNSSMQTQNLNQDIDFHSINSEKTQDVSLGSSDETCLSDAETVLYELSSNKNSIDHWSVEALISNDNRDISYTSEEESPSMISFFELYAEEDSVLGEAKDTGHVQSQTTFVSDRLNEYTPGCTTQNFLEDGEGFYNLSGTENSMSILGKRSPDQSCSRQESTTCLVSTTRVMDERLHSERYVLLKILILNVFIFFKSTVI